MSMVTVKLRVWHYLGEYSAAYSLFPLEAATRGLMSKEAATSTEEGFTIVTNVFNR